MPGFVYTQARLCKTKLEDLPFNLAPNSEQGGLVRWVEIRMENGVEAIISESRGRNSIFDKKFEIAITHHDAKERRRIAGSTWPITASQESEVMGILRDIARCIINPHLDLDSLRAVGKNP